MKMRVKGYYTERIPKKCPISDGERIFTAVISGYSGTDAHLVRKGQKNYEIFVKHRGKVLTKVIFRNTIYIVFSTHAFRVPKMQRVV